jgi:hypothetical protein
MRFVIKNPNVVDPQTREVHTGYFTEFAITKSVEVRLDGALLGTEQTRGPLFEAQSPKWATKFDTQADAELQIRNEFRNHGGPEAFAGCVVQSFEG